jgi:DNA polymerase III subunit delta'
MSGSALPQISDIDPVLTAYQAKAFSRLFELHGSSKIPPALLVTGIEGVGKRSLVLSFVRKLFCDSLDMTGEVCGTCASCLRAQNNQWIDLHWIAPQSDDDEKTGSHSVETLRELLGKQGFGPSQEPYRVVVIEHAQRMTPQAANSILKTLEEPPKGWIFFLIAENISQVLPTIRSRCDLIRIPTLPIHAIEEHLKRTSSADQNHLKFAARFSQGSLGKAKEALQEEFLENRNLILECLSFPDRGFLPLFDAAAQGQRSMQRILALIETVLSDLLLELTHSHEDVRLHPDYQTHFQKMIRERGITTQSVMRVMERLQEIRRATLSPLNARILAQEVVASLLKIFPEK